MSWHAHGTIPGLDLELMLTPLGMSAVDITERLYEFSTSFGSSLALGVVPPGKGTFRLRNQDGELTPANTGGTYYGQLVPGCKLVYKERYGGTSSTVWTGVVDDWGDSFPQSFQALITITTTQPTTLLADWSAETVAPPYVAPPGDPITVEAHNTVGSGERSDERISRVLTDAGWAFGSSLATGVVSCQGTRLDTIKGIAAITAAVQAEGGAFWCEPSGSVTFEHRHQLATASRSTTSQATFGPGMSEVPYTDEPQMASGYELLTNRATRGNVNQSPVTVTNAASVTALGRVWADSPQTSMIGANPYDADGLAWYETRLHGEAISHPTAITIMPAASPSTAWAQALGRRFRDRITVKVPTPFGTLEVPCWIAGISHSGTLAKGRTTTFRLDPAGSLDDIEIGPWDGAVWDAAEWAW